MQAKGLQSDKKIVAKTCTDYKMPFFSLLMHQSSHQQDSIRRMPKSVKKSDARIVESEHDVKCSAKMQPKSLRVKALLHLIRDSKLSALMLSREVRNDPKLYWVCQGSAKLSLAKQHNEVPYGFIDGLRKQSQWRQELAEVSMVHESDIMMEIGEKLQNVLGDVMKMDKWHGKRKKDRSSRSVQERTKKILDAESARNTVIESNINLVFEEVENRTRDCTDDYDEQIQAGHLGLIGAVESFNVYGEKSFTDYAREKIRRSIESDNENSRLIRLPKYRLDDLSAFEARQSQLSHEKGFAPNREEVFRAMKVSSVKRSGIECGLTVQDSFDHGAQVFLDCEMPSDSHTDENLEYIDDRNNVFKSLALLEHDEQILMMRHYGLAHFQPTTIKQIARSMEISVKKANEVHNKALEKVRGWCNSKY